MKSILITGDSATTFCIVNKYIRIVGVHDANIMEAQNESSALHIMQKNKVDMVFMDLSTPGSGSELFMNYIKSNPETEGIPVVVITDADYTIKKRALIKQGAAAVISKPLSPLRIHIAIDKTNLFGQNWIEQCFA